MKKLYDTKEILFAILWIVIYCVVLTAIRGNLGDTSPWMLLALAAIAAGATVFIRRYGLQEKYGLTPWPRPARPYLWFLPMLVLGTGNLWGGFSLRYEGFSLVFAALSLALVGYVEEVIFRGFLFRAMLKEGNPKVAVIVASVTFGLGHIMNLFTGQATLETLVQICYAVAWGFMFTYAFYKSGCLWPSVIAHAMVDALSVFARDSDVMSWVYVALTILIAIPYCLYLRKLPAPREGRAA